MQFTYNAYELLSMTLLKSLTTDQTDACDCLQTDYRDYPMMYMASASGGFHTFDM